MAKNGVPEPPFIHTTTLIEKVDSSNKGYVSKSLKKKNNLLSRICCQSFCSVQTNEKVTAIVE